MNGLNISQACEKEWEKTLETGNYQKLNNNLSKLLLDFLSLDNIKVQKNSEMMKSLVQEFAKILGVKINRVEIVYDENSSVLGGYNDENKLVALNLSNNNLSSFGKTEFLTTIFHELRHAQQKQIITKFENSELSETMKLHFNNYTVPNGKIIKNAKYFSNFNEVDAEIFSYVYLDNILNQLKNNPEFSNYNAIISQTEIAHNSASTKFKSDLDSSLKLIELNNKAIKTLTESITNYSKLLFSNDRNIPKEILDEQAKLLIIQADEIFSGKAKELVDFTASNFFAMQEAMYGQADTTEIARNLDSPFIKYIEHLEDKFGDLGLDKYNRYSRRIKKIIEDGKAFLKVHNIPFNEKDNGDVIKQVIDNMPAVYMENLINPINEEQMQKDHNLSSLIDTYLAKDKDYLHLKCARFVESQIPKKQLRQYIEALVDKNIKGTSDFDMRYDILGGYANKYDYEKRWHTKETFLTYAGIKCKNLPYSDIHDKFEVTFPKFLAKAFVKTKLNEQEQEFVTNYMLGVYGNINLELFKENANKQLFFKTKLKQILSDDHSKNPILKAFNERKVDIVELFSENNQSQKENN